MTNNNDLKSRIAAAKAKHDDDPTNDPGYKPDNSQGMGNIRYGIELVSAVAVGALIGYGIDIWLGTAPFGMIIFFFMGFAAGFLNIYKAQTGNYHKTGIAQLTNTEKNGQKDAEKPEQ